MKDLEIDKLIYHWEDHAGEYPKNPFPEKTKIHDESHRDGLQSRKKKEPSLTETIEQMRLMSEAGIDCANIGFPVSSSIRYEMIKQVALSKQKENWKMDIMCAARLDVKDIEAIVKVADKTGTRIWVGTFLPGSEIAARVLGWDLEEMAKKIQPTIEFARRHQLPVMFVTEDSSRSYYKNVELFNQLAIDSGANRLCITDTVGESDEEGVRKLVGFVKNEVIRDQKVDGNTVELEWHGHNHLGLALSNTLAAIKGGADRVEGTLLGRGEMMGNAPTELIALNMVKRGWANYDLKHFIRLCNRYATSIGVEIPGNWPLAGKYAYMAGSGVHADRIMKAYELGRPDLAGLVYCSYDMHGFGRIPDADLNQLSGRASVLLFLKQRGITDVSDEVVDRILNSVKSNLQTIPEEEILSLIK